MANLNLKKQTSWYNPFFVAEGIVLRTEVKNIFIFNSEGVLAETKKGWFCEGNNNFKEPSFDFEVINKRKEDFTKKQCYMIKQNLYIHVDLLQNVSIQKHVFKFATDMEKAFCDIITFDAAGTKYVYNGEKKEYELKDGTHQGKIECNFSFEKTDFGARMQMLANKAKENGLNYSAYDFEKLSKFFDINVK